jgi:formamidopyrimidine-DNA glycosylase
MPELPDITVYIEALETRILGQTLEGVRIVSPFSPSHNGPAHL